MHCGQRDSRLPCPPLRSPLCRLLAQGRPRLSAVTWACACRHVAWRGVAWRGVGRTAHNTKAPVYHPSSPGARFGGRCRCRKDLLPPSLPYFLPPTPSPFGASRSVPVTALYIRLDSFCWQSCRNARRQRSWLHIHTYTHSHTCTRSLRTHINSNKKVIGSFFVCLFASDENVFIFFPWAFCLRPVV